MKYSTDRNSPKHAYIQLYEQLRRDITDNTLKYGQKLPSKRLLAEETGVSIITVEHAYEILCEEGYAEARERRGYFVIYKKSDLVPISEGNYAASREKYYYHGEETFPFSVFAGTMRSVISKYGENILIKSPNSGCIELRRAISDYLARGKGIKVSPEQIIIGSGAEYLYGLIVQFLGNDKLYALEKPSYDKILSVYQTNGAECDLLLLGKNGILTSELVRTKATVLHVTPFRSFPSGVTASASKRFEYVEWAKKRNGIIIEDDFNSEFTLSTKNEDTLFSLEPQKSVIYLNTFTKTVAPSMRIGYMVLPKSLISSFQEKLGFYSCTVPIFEQYLLTELIQSGNLERHINRTRRRMRRTKKENDSK